MSYEKEEAALRASPRAGRVLVSESNSKSLVKPCSLGYSLSRPLSRADFQGSVQQLPNDSLHVRVIELPAPHCPIANSAFLIEEKRSG